MFNRKMLGLAGLVMMAARDVETGSAGGGAGSANSLLNPAEYPATVKASAAKMLPGKEYEGRSDYVVSELAKGFGKDPDDVRKDLEAAYDKLPKPKVRKEDDAKKMKAAALSREADKLEQEAAEVLAAAKRKRAEAQAASADAEGRVVVSVPRSFWLNTDKGRVLIQAGTPTLPREHAEHEYAKAHGVTITGLPADAEKDD